MGGRKLGHTCCVWDLLSMELERAWVMSRGPRTSEGRVMLEQQGCSEGPRSKH
jgi:hypothetical protein